MAFLDVGGRPDGMKGLVQAEPRLDVARKAVGRGDDGFKRRTNKGVAMSLAAGQRAGIAPQEWQMRREFLA